MPKTVRVGSILKKIFMEVILEYLLIISIVGGIFGLLMLIAGWMIIAKSGQPGVAIIVPIWQIIAVLQAAGKPWWWLFLFCIPIVGFPILWIYMLNGLSKNFGKGVGFTVGLVLLFPIFWLILGFGGKYVGAKKEELPQA